jgi:hypothetical protein
MKPVKLTGEGGGTFAQSRDHRRICSHNRCDSDLWPSGHTGYNDSVKNLWAFSFQVADSNLYALGYKLLDEAREKMSGDYDAMLGLAAVAAAHAGMASAVLWIESQRLRGEPVSRGGVESHIPTPIVSGSHSTSHPALS